MPYLEQGIDRRRRNDPLDAARQLRIQRDERVCLEQREREVLGVVRLRPAQLIRYLPGATSEHGVAKKPDRHLPYTGESLACDIGRELAPLHSLVQSRQRLGPQQRRRKQLVLGLDLDPLTRQIEHGAGVDYEPGHPVSDPTAAWYGQLLCLRDTVATVKTLERSLCAVFAVSVLAGLLVASAALAGRLPASGIWRYDNRPTVKTTNGNAVFQALIVVEPGKSNIREIAGEVIGATCKTKDGRTIRDAIAAFHLNGYTRAVISVRPDGSFSATKKSDSDVSRGGTFTVKGVIRGKYVSGTVTAHEPHNAVWGDCKGTGKFVRAKGEQIA